MEKNQRAALDACQQLLRDRGVQAMLIDAERLFDNRGLWFYFLGTVPSEFEDVITQLASAYDAEVRFDEFAEAVTAGCGPGCGTDAAAGCGHCDSGCALVGHCSISRR
jgi:hypothetical protein